MSYAAILEKLDQTSIDMELKRTQFHDAKSALENAEENLNKLDKENIDYKSFRNDLKFYEDFEKAKDAFKDENYEKSKEIALQSSEASLNTIVEIDILISDKNKIREVLDDALIEKLQFDKKEKDDVKKSIKDIEKAIETGKLTDASQKTEHIIEKLETKITRKRILKFAPTNWNELEKLDKTTELYEYYINEKWDLDGIKDDLKILEQRKNEKEDIGIELTGIPDVWKELSTLDKQAKESDYRVGNSWDISGIRDDLALLNNRNQKLQVFEAKWPLKEKKKSPQFKDWQKETIDRKVPKFKKNKESEDYFAYPEAESKNTKLDDLKYLKELLDSGLIDDEEFKQMKKEILEK